MRTIERQEAYAAIDSERDYQDAMTADPSRQDMIENLSAGDIILAMENCLSEARATWYLGSVSHYAAAHAIRKVAALGVRFMEVHGSPPRRMI